MKEQIVKYKMELIGLVFGMLAGWNYWYFVGCASGTCPITSSATISTIYGAITGWFLFGSFSKSKQEKSKQ